MNAGDPTWKPDSPETASDAGPGDPPSPDRGAEPQAAPPGGAPPAAEGEATAAEAGSTAPAEPPPAPDPGAPPAEPVAAEAPPEPAGTTAPAEPADPDAERVRVGRVGSGRKLAPASDEVMRAIRDFAMQRRFPVFGTLVDLARAHDSGSGPGLGRQEFTEIYGALGRIVRGVESVAIQVGPVLFVKTTVKNQPGTALHWLSAAEREALAERPALLDQPARLASNLKRLSAGEPHDADESEAD